MKEGLRPVYPRRQPRVPDSRVRPFLNESIFDRDMFSELSHSTHVTASQFLNGKERGGLSQFLSAATSTLTQEIPDLHWPWFNIPNFGCFWLFSIQPDG